MRRGGGVFGVLFVAGCSYGPAPERVTPCSTANAERLEARQELRMGELAGALGSIEAANAGVHRVAGRDAG